MLAFLISILFLGLLISFTTYQSDSLSLRWLSILKVTQKGVVFPIFYEVAIIIALFELFYLIGFRQSKFTISSTVVLIGGLIIGENLVTSGVTGVFIMTFTAITFLMTFVVSSNVTILMSISVVRILIMISSFYLGLYGVILAAILLVYLMYRQTTFGVHYFYPFIPFDVSGIKKFFTSSSSLKNNTRDEPLKVKNKYRRSIR